jgi:hypothetical protein
MHLSPSDWAYLDERADSFVGRDWLFEHVRDFLAGPAGIFLLRGDPGTGKTAVAARLAQASCGRSNSQSGPPAAALGAFDAAVVCRSGQVDLLDVAQQLSTQLAAVPAFDRVLRATLTSEVNIDVTMDIGQVLGAADIAGVRIGLDRLGPERAFSMGVALPLRRLADSGAEPLAILVDALDEAVSSTTARGLPRLLGELAGIKLIATTRDDPRVLAQLGESITSLHIRDDAPPGTEDLLVFVNDRLTRLGPAHSMELLARRIAKQAEGNFLYCRYVTDALDNPGMLSCANEKTVMNLALPAGGLPGVYREFLRRELTRDEVAWAKDIRPILAPLAVARGDGLTPAQLAVIGSQLAGHPITGTSARDVTRITRQFLDGLGPYGPFRPFHQSFADFLTNPAQNPDWLVEAEEAHAAVANALLAAVPRGADGTKQWTNADEYTLKYLSAHAVLAGILDDLLLDPGYLLAADPPELFAALAAARSQDARRAAAAYRRVAHRLTNAAEPARASYLRLGALQAGAKELLRTHDVDSAQMAESAGWLPTWAWWRPANASRVIGELPSYTRALAALVTEQGPLAVAAGEFGIEVWDIDSGRCLAGCPGDVFSLAVGYVDGRPVVLAGHGGGTVSLHGLPALNVVARNLSGHTDAVQAATILAGGSIAATGGDDGALVLWQLPALTQLATQPRAHTRVIDLAAATLDGAQVLISAGNTFKDGSQDEGVQPVRAWALPALTLVCDIETECALSMIVEAVSSSLGCIVVYKKYRRVEVKLITADGTVKPIGTCDDELSGLELAALLVMSEGDEPELITINDRLALLKINLTPVNALTLGPHSEVDYIPFWAGPVALNERRVLLSANTILRAWDLDDLLATSFQHDDLSQHAYDPTSHYADAVVCAGEVLVMLIAGTLVHRWNWRSGEGGHSLIDSGVGRLPLVVRA